MLRPLTWAERWGWVSLIVAMIAAVVAAVVVSATQDTPATLYLRDGTVVTCADYGAHSHACRNPGRPAVYYQDAVIQRVEMMP